MESEKSFDRIGKLTYNNYYAWKQKISLLLALKDLNDHLSSSKPEDAALVPVWEKKDKLVQALIGLNLSDEILESVRHVDTAVDMWNTIKNIFERHTLLNKLSARRKFYTAIKSERESVLEFSNRIQHMSSTLKSMNVEIDDSEMAMTLLCGLPDPYDHLISALDAMGTDEKILKFDHIKSRVMQEEQRISMRISAANSKSEVGALISNCANCNVANTSRPKCTHCGKLGHSVDKCWKKHPHLNPHKKKNPSDTRAALVANQINDDPGAICLFGKHVSNTESKYSDWLIDSGCSNHMTYDKSLFSKLSKPPTSHVKLGNGYKAEITGCGTITMKLHVSGKITPVLFENVFLVPELGYQLLSVSTFSKRGFSTLFENDRCFVKRGNTTVVSGTLHGTLYKLDTPSAYQTTPHAFTASTLEVWHKRLAHVDPVTIVNMVDNNIVTGIDLKKQKSNNIECDGCTLGKGHRSPIPKKSKSRSSNILELVHSDVNGPLDTASLGGSRYFITFIDDFSKWTVVYTMRKKSDSFNCFKIYHKYAEVHTGRQMNKLNVIRRSNKTEEQIKALRTDNGGEYISNQFKDYLLEHGISHQLTVAYTPQQNGVAERMNRTLVDLVRSMIHSAGLEKKFWAEALQTAVHVRNRITSRSLPPSKTPHHLWMNKVPDLSYLRIFGSNCFYTIPKSKVKKLDPRSRKAILMGYSTQSKGYKLWDPESRKMLVSRDVTFRETCEDPSPTIIPSEDCEGINRGGEHKVRFDASTSENDSAPENSDNNETLSDQSTGHQSELDEDPNLSDSDNIQEEIDATETQEESSSPTSAGPRRSNRKFTQTKPYWLSLLSHALSAQVVPISYKKATTDDNIDFWKPGIDREHDCLLRNNTWTVIDRKPGMHVLPCKYVFRVKDGNPKARMVILGCKQIFGLDYYHTFAPVVKFTTIRTLLAIVATEDWECEQMDVVTAFLNGDLDEDIYMHIPEGLKTSENESKVCKLNKALYGLKQAPRQWYAKIHDYLTNDLKFTSSINDPCLYIRKSSNEILIIALYVDDLLLIGNSTFMIDKLKGEFKKRFEMKDLGAVAVMLGIEIKRDRSNRKLYISQREYTDHVLNRFGMSQCRPVTTPMEKASSKPKSELLDIPADDVPYRQAIGSLIYLVTGSRPDIAFAVSKLSQHLDKPLNSHWLGVKRVMRYLAGTRTHGILYEGARGIKVEGYSDSDYAGCTDSRKSTSGYIFLIAGGAVSWKSKKQSNTATSTCEAEYMACCATTKEAVWLSRLISDIRFLPIPEPITIGIDNAGTIYLSNNPAINERSKHIDVQYHFVRECVQLKKIKLIHCNTDDQLADSLTKPLERVKHSKFTELQGLQRT